MVGGPCSHQTFPRCLDKNEHAPIAISPSSFESFSFCDNYHLKYLFTSVVVPLYLQHFSLPVMHSVVIIKIVPDLYSTMLKRSSDQAI